MTDGGGRGENVDGGNNEADETVWMLVVAPMAVLLQVLMVLVLWILMVVRVATGDVAVVLVLVIQKSTTVTLSDT